MADKDTDEKRQLDAWIHIPALLAQGKGDEAVAEYERFAAPTESPEATMPYSAITTWRRIELPAGSGGPLPEAALRLAVGWSLRQHMQTELCLEVLRQAVVTRHPGSGLLHHTDRGSQYTSDDHQEALQAIGATPSMSRKGTAGEQSPSATAGEAGQAYSTDWSGESGQGRRQIGHRARIIPWFDSGKVRQELGWSLRPLAETLADMAASLNLDHRRASSVS